jgi:hypothetical protein
MKKTFVVVKNLIFSLSLSVKKVVSMCNQSTWMLYENDNCKLFDKKKKKNESTLYFSPENTL